MGVGRGTCNVERERRSICKPGRFARGLRTAGNFQLPVPQILILAHAKVYIEGTMRLTPQQKKELSYKHDRRNCYGENPSASRKAIPRNKALSRRSVRRANKQCVRSLGDDHSEVVAEAKLKLKMRTRWEKVPDCPLGEHIAFQRKKRAKLRGRHSDPNWKWDWFSE